MFNEVCLFFSFIPLSSTQLGNCKRADVVFLLDSALITDANWNLTMTLSQHVALCLRASCCGTRVAKLQFVCNNSVVYGLENKLEVISNRSKSSQTRKFLNDAFYVPDRVIHHMKVGDGQNLIKSYYMSLSNLEINS